MEIERKTSLFFGLSNLSRLLDGWLAGIDWFPKLKSSEREINVVWWCGGMRTVKMSSPRQILWSSVPVLAFPHTDTRLMDFKFCTPSINCYRRRRQPFFFFAPTWQNILGGSQQIIDIFFKELSALSVFPSRQAMNQELVAKWMNFDFNWIEKSRKHV